MMVEAATKREWTTRSFLAWLADRHGGEHRWEFVDGVPTMMTTPVKRHGNVVGNVSTMLRERLQGTPCRPCTGDLGIETRPDQFRLPDVLVDCSPTGMVDATARDPKLIVEVPSPSTRAIDTLGKLEWYKSVPGLAHLVVIDPMQPDVVLWSRAGEGWAYERHTDLEASLALPASDAFLPLDGIYEDVTFEE